MVRARTAGPRWEDVTVGLDPTLARYVAEKGSIAVSGVSLTVTWVGDDEFGVSLIPTTLAATTLGDAAPGAAVNLEVDVLAKYTERLLAATGGGVTASFYDGRNAIYVLVKDYPGALWRRYGLRILRQQMRVAWEALRAWRGAAARARLRGMFAGLVQIPHLLRKRRAIQKSRRVTIEYLESILSDVL